MTLVKRNMLNAAVGSATALIAVIVACLMVVGDDTPARQVNTQRVGPRNPSQSVLDVPGASDTTRDSRAMSKADQEELLRKIERLESLVADSTPREVSREVDDPTGGPDEVDPFSPEAEEERARAQFQAQAETLESALQAEFVDEDWAKPTMIALREAFEAESDEGIEMLDVDCRGSMCRLHLAFDPARVEESFRKLQGVVPWGGEIFFHVDDVDNGEAVVYIAREDQRLPRASE